LGFVRQNICDIKESIALKANVYERRIHARKYVLYDSLEDAANDSLLSLDAILLELPVLEHGNPSLSEGTVDDDFCGWGARGFSDTGRRT
jgi:hypothetical protein